MAAMIIGGAFYGDLAHLMSHKETRNDGCVPWSFHGCKTAEKNSPDLSAKKG